jgi:hypothetical protein
MDTNLLFIDLRACRRVCDGSVVCVMVVVVVVVVVVVGYGMYEAMSLLCLYPFHTHTYTHTHIHTPLYKMQLSDADLKIEVSGSVKYVNSLCDHISVSYDTSNITQNGKAEYIPRALVTATANMKSLSLSLPSVSIGDTDNKCAKVMVAAVLPYGYQVCTDMVGDTTTDTSTVATISDDAQVFDSLHTALLSVSCFRAVFDYQLFVKLQALRLAASSGSDHDE